MTQLLVKRRFIANYEPVPQFLSSGLNQELSTYLPSAAAFRKGRSVWARYPLVSELVMLRNCDEPRVEDLLSEARAKATLLNAEGSKFKA
jgi:hypothetical protein